MHGITSDITSWTMISQLTQLRIWRKLLRW